MMEHKLNCFIKMEFCFKICVLLVVLVVMQPQMSKSDFFEVHAPSLVEEGTNFEIEFYTNFTTYSDIVCFWDFSDNTSYQNDALYLQSNLQHSYEESGVYMIMTVCEAQGGFSGHYSEVLVYRNISFERCAYRSVNLTYAHDVYVLGETDILLYYHKDFENPLYYYMEINQSPVFENSFSYGPLENDELYTVPMDSILISIELQYILGLGIHNVSVTVFEEENATAAYCESEMKLVELISGLVFYLSDFYIVTNTPFIGSVAATSGWPALIEWKAYNEGDRLFDFYFDSYRQARSPYEMDEVWLYISRPGNYTVSATIYHEINDETESATVIVENPIREYWVSTNSPIIYPQSTELVMTLNFSGDPLPEDVNITEPRYPSNVLCDIDYGDGILDTFLPLEMDNGNVTLTHTYASPGVYELLIFMYNYVSSVHYYLEVGVLEEITDAQMYSFSGETKNLTKILPLEFPALFTVEIPQGTIQFCNWMVDSVPLNISTFSLEYKFDAEGDYLIDVFVRNEFSGMGMTMTVTVVQAITAMYLINDGPVSLSEPVTFVVFVAQLGTNSSFYLDFGDGSDGTPVEPAIVEDVMSYIASSIDLPLDPEDMLAFIVSHDYSSPGVYTATLIGENPVSSRLATSAVFVQDVPCQIATLHILDGDSSYSTSKGYPRSKRFQFAAEVDVDCSHVLSTPTYKWSLHKLTEVFPIPSPENAYKLPSSVHTNLITFYIPAFMLDYGDYVFRLELTFHLEDGSVAVKKDDQTYASVVETPLFAAINGGSSIAVAWAYGFMVDGSVSYDPDYPGDDVDLTFSWFCRRSYETFPSNDDLLLLINDYLGTGGCFDRGFFLQSSSSPHMYIYAQTLEGNQAYVFGLILSKTGRQDVSAQQTITVLPGDPPTIHIQCLMNCGLKVNPSSRLVISAKCQDCTEHTRPTYSWSLIPASPGNSKHELAWNQDTTTSSSNSYLSIKANTFLGSERYIMRLAVDTWSGASTFAEYAFITNSPPDLGLCSVSPVEGVALTTKFSVTCNGFEDEDEPLSYEIKAVTGAEIAAGISSLQDTLGAGALIYFGVDPSIPPSNLPVGLAERDHRVVIYITVADRHGASVYTNVTAKVKEPEVRPFETMTDTVLEFTSGEESPLNALVDSGNAQGATQLVYTLTSLLNTEADSDNKITEALNEEEIAEEGQLLDEKKAKRAEARESIIKNICDIEVRDMESLQQTSAAIAQVTRAKDEISAKAQVSAAESYQKMSTFLKEQSESGAGGESVEETAGFIMTGLSNIMEAAFISLSPEATGLDDNANKAQATETKQNTRNVTLATLQALDELQTAILQNKVPGEDLMVIDTEALSLVLQRQEKWQVASSVRDSKSGPSYFQLPENALDGNDGINYDAIIDSSMHRYHNNPFAWSSRGAGDITTHVTSLELQLSNGNEHTILELSNLTTYIDMFLESEPRNITALQLHYYNQTNQYHYDFNATSDMPYVVIEVLITNRSLVGDSLPEIELALARKDVEFLDITIPEEAAPPVAQWNDTSNITGNPYLWIIPFSDIGASGQLELMLKGWEAMGVNQSVYKVFAYGARCVYWNETSEMWDNSGCKVGPLTSQSVTHCQCNHLSHFAAGFFVLPNTVHIIKDAVLFTKILSNPIAVVVVGTLLGLFILLGLWARRSDKTEEEQAHIIFLADNKPEDKYRYHVTVFTGMRWGGGSTAVATITLRGRRRSSLPHKLASDDSHKILRRGGIDSFILTTKKSLGELKSLRVWHDNSGNSPEWNINRIMVNDLQTKESWYFICRSWLAVDIGECTIDKTFPVASEDDLHQFEHLFTSRLIRDMKDHHLWVSVFMRPRNNNFSRVQRVACCFTLLMMSMLASIMFYGVTPEDEEAAHSSGPDMDETIRLGSFQVTWFDIIVGIESGLITLPLNLLILMVFRNIRRRRNELIETIGILRNKENKEWSAITSQIPANTSQEPANTSQMPTSPSKKHLMPTSKKRQEPDVTSTASTASRDSFRSVLEDLNALGRKKLSNKKISQLSVGKVEISIESETKIEKKTRFPFSMSQAASAEEMQSSSETAEEGSSPAFKSHDEFLCHQMTQLYEQMNEAPDSYFESEEERKKAIKKLEKIMVTHGKDIRKDVRQQQQFKGEVEGIKCCHASGCLPWWFVFVGWFLVAATNIISAYLIILYGLSYGKETTMSWLVSMVIMLVQSVCVLQPGKVILVAAFFAMVWKKHEDDNVGLHLFDSEDPGLFSSKANSKGHKEEEEHFYHPLPPDRVEQAKEKRQVQLKMYKMVRELLGTIILVAIALEVAHLQRDHNAYLLHQSLEDTFTPGFEDVTTMNDVYRYLAEPMLEGLYGDTRGFLADGKNFRVGRVRLRQVRTAPGSCHRPHKMGLLINCTGTLRRPQNTDKKTYYMSWSSPLSGLHCPYSTVSTSLENNPWIYTYEKESKGSYHLGKEGLYTRGGYIMVLGSTSLSTVHYLKELKDKSWLDEYTRALYVEWTVYNPNTGLLCTCTILFEATMFGDVAASSQFHAFKPFSMKTTIDIVNIVLQSTFILVILLLIHLEIKKFIRKGMDYFNLWNVLNVFTILISVLAVVMYIMWAVSLATALKDFKQNPIGFTSFFFPSLIDQVLMNASALLVFVNTLRCAKILRYNRSILTFNNTFSCICNQFFMFTLTLVIILFAFSILFCITFGSEARDFKDLASSFQTIFRLLQGGYAEFMDVTDLHPRLSPFYFIIMTFSLYFLLFHFFILLILHSFGTARQMTPHQDQRDVLSAFVDWVSSLFFIKRVKQNNNGVKRS